MKDSRLSRRAHPRTPAFSLKWPALPSIGAALACLGGCASASAPLPVPAATLPASAPASESVKENNPAHSAAQSKTQTPSASQPQPQTQGQTHAIANPAEAQQSRGELAMLRIEVMSLKEKMATLQRKFDVILKGQRSGIYDDVQLPANIQTHLMPAKVNPVPPLVSEGPVDRMDDDSAPVQRQAVLNVENPQQIVDKALILLERREFGRVAQALENFQQRFPNNALSAVAELTLAEAYVELKTPQQALIHVRTFYLQHPNDPLLNRAKWLEAQSHEQLSAPQKAAQLYREVIALNPQAQLALQARTALEKLSAGGAQ